MLLLLISAVYGLLSASALHAFFHSVLRYHAEWWGTILASMATSLACGGALVFQLGRYEEAAEFFVVRIVGLTLLASLAVGFVSFRLLVRSSSARRMNGQTALVAAAGVATPLLVLELLAHFLLLS